MKKLQVGISKDGQSKHSSRYVFVVSYMCKHSRLERSSDFQLKEPYDEPCVRCGGLFRRIDLVKDISLTDMREVG